MIIATVPFRRNDVRSFGDQSQGTGADHEEVRDELGTQRRQARVHVHADGRQRSDADDRSTEVKNSRSRNRFG